MNKKIYQALIIGIVFILSLATANAARLPTVGEDSNQWGTLLNEYLLVSHTQNGTLNSSLSPTFNGLTLTDRLIIDNPGPSFTGTGSKQAVQADAIFNDYTGSSYGGGVMGNALGSLSSTASNSIIAGLIGKYNIDSTGSNAGPKGAVVGEVGEEATGTKADGAFIAVLGGNDPDTGAITPGAAYTVRYLNVNPASKFDYGLDLLGAQIFGHQPVTYGIADIQLSNGATIFNNDASTLTITEGTIVLAGDLTLNSGVINTAEIADNAITNAKIVASAGIPYSKLTLTDSIVNADINSAAAIDLSKLAASEDEGGPIGGNIIITGNDGIPYYVALSGDASIDSVGTLTIGSDAVTAAKVGFNYAGSLSEGGAATTATALAANGANCEANQFALGVDAGGIAECAAIVDDNVPNTITASNYLLLAGGTLTGNLLINGARVSNTNGYEQYLKVNGDLTGVGDGGNNAKTWVIQSTATRQAGANVQNGDFDDVGVKVSMTNKATGNVDGYILRGIDVSSTSRDGGKVTTLSGGHISATQKANSPVSTLTGATIKVEADSPNTAPSTIYGLNVEYDNVADTGIPTNSAGIRVNQNSDYYVSYPLAGFLVDNGAEAMKWQYGLVIDDNTISKADIKLSKSAAEPSACDATTEGAIYYKSADANSHFYGCRKTGADAYAWTQLDNT